MVDRKTAARIAGILASAGSVEEIEVLYAASGLNLPSDPYLRCKALFSCLKTRRDARRTRVQREFLATGGTNDTMKKVSALLAEYALREVRLTDEQAGQVLCDLAFRRSQVPAWKRAALMGYWKRKRRSEWART